METLIRLHLTIEQAKIVAACVPIAIGSCMGVVDGETISEVVDLAAAFVHAMQAGVHSSEELQSTVDMAMQLSESVRQIEQLFKAGKS